MNIDQSSEFIVCDIGRARIESMDISSLLAQYDIGSMSSEELRRLFGQVVFYPSGFDADGELYTIPAVRHFLRSWRAQWPYLLFFGYLGDDNLKALYLGLLDSLEGFTSSASGQNYVKFNLRELTKLLAADLTAANALSITAGLDPKERQKRASEIIKYFARK